MLNVIPDLCFEVVECANGDACCKLDYWLKDELLWGAAWLHKATRNPTYLNYIQANGQTLGAGETDNTFGWDNKHIGARILLSKVIFLKTFLLEH